MDGQLVGATRAASIVSVAGTFLLLCVLPAAAQSWPAFSAPQQQGGSSTVRRLPALDTAGGSRDQQLARVAAWQASGEPQASAFTPEQVRELEQRLAALREASSEPALGYDRGFVIRGPKGDDGESLFRMRINSWTQLRHTFFDSDGPNADENDFEFERLRLIFSGHAYDPDLAYFVQLDGDSDQQETVDVLDYYITYDFGHDVLGHDEGRLGVKLGKWKLPFNRARYESGWQLQFADRAVASVFFDIDRSIGVALFGRFGCLGRDVQWEAALFDGIKTSQFQPGRSGDLDRNPGVSVRLMSDVWGEWGSDGEPDLSFHPWPAVRVGGGFAFTRVDQEGAAELARQRVVDSGQTLASLLPASVTGYDVALYSIDVNFKYRGLSVLTEYYFRTLSGFSGAVVPTLFDHGFLLQSGYFVVPETLELLVRWSRLQGDSGTLGAGQRSADEIAGGVVWYIRGHSAKLTFDVTHLNGAPISDAALNIRPGDDGWLYRTQFQLQF